MKTITMPLDEFDSDKHKEFQKGYRKGEEHMLFTLKPVLHFVWELIHKNPDSSSFYVSFDNLTEVRKTLRRLVAAVGPVYFTPEGWSVETIKPEEK